MDLTSIVPILVNFLDVKYQGKLISPFEAHPIATGVAICSLLLRFLLVHVRNQTPPSGAHAPPSNRALHLLIDFTGSISVALLVWLLLHDSFHSVQWFVLLPLLSVNLLRSLIQKLLLWFCRQLFLVIIRLAWSRAWLVERAEPPLERVVVDMRFMLEAP